MPFGCQCPPRGATPKPRFPHATQGPCCLSPPPPPPHLLSLLTYNPCPVSLSAPLLPSRPALCCSQPLASYGVIVISISYNRGLTSAAGTYDDDRLIAGRGRLVGMGGGGGGWVRCVGAGRSGRLAGSRCRRKARRPGGGGGS